MTTTDTTQQQDEFMAAFNGSFVNMLRWHQLDSLWQTLGTQTKKWYVYAVGEPPPQTILNNEQLSTFISEIDTLLHKDHGEDYCGIVYVDQPDNPDMIKIYDPHNLGSVCGSSGAPPPLPGWIMSTLPPIDLPSAMPLPGNRRRWWQRLFNTA